MVLPEWNEDFTFYLTDYLPSDPLSLKFTVRVQRCATLVCVFMCFVLMCEGVLCVRVLMCVFVYATWFCLRCVADSMQHLPGRDLVRML